MGYSDKPKKLSYEALLYKMGADLILYSLVLQNGTKEQIALYEEELKKHTTYKQTL